MFFLGIQCLVLLFEVLSQLLLELLLFLIDMIQIYFTRN